MKRIKLVIFVLASLLVTTAFGALAVPSHDVKGRQNISIMKRH